jgi:hypothetical protein
MAFISLFKLRAARINKLRGGYISPDKISSLGPASRVEDYKMAAEDLLGASSNVASYL